MTIYIISQSINMNYKSGILTTPCPPHAYKTYERALRHIELSRDCHHLGELDREFISEDGTLVSRQYHRLDTEIETWYDYEIWKQEL